MALLETAATTHTLTLLAPEAALADASVRREWESLLNLAHPLHRVFASPTLYEHATRRNPLPENRVAVIRDHEGKAVGICPIVFWRRSMPFGVGKRVFGKIMVKAATILSREPLVPADPALYRLLFDGLFEGLPWCDCVFIDSMPIDCFTCAYIYSKENRDRRYLIYPATVKAREWIYLELGESLESFLKEKLKRTRNTLKRRVKKLTEHGGGSLECIRVEDDEQVDSFYESALSIAEKSWQFQNLGRALSETALYRESLHELACLGSLRAYLLKCGGRPCAFVIGCQYQDVLQFEQTAYSPEFATFSPGTVLYYRLLDDLYRHRRPTLVNHGVGVTPHKRLFSNRSMLDTEVFLFRPTFRNRIRCSSHGLFYKGVDLAKRITGRTTGPPVEEHENE